MFSREEKTKIKEAFWTVFGQYMKGVPVLDEEGKKKNWLNYKTGVRGIRFKTDATDKKAYIGIELIHRDEDERFLVYEQFLSLKKLLTDELQEEWIWEKEYSDAFGKSSSRIYRKLPDVNIFRQEDWPTLISFSSPEYWLWTLFGKIQSPFLKIFCKEYFYYLFPFLLLFNTIRMISLWIFFILLLYLFGRLVFC